MYTVGCGTYLGNILFGTYEGNFVDSNLLPSPESMLSYLKLFQRKSRLLMTSRVKI
jgi:hypothetical protein